MNNEISISSVATPCQGGFTEVKGDNLKVKYVPLESEIRVCKLCKKSYTQELYVPGKASAGPLGREKSRAYYFYSHCRACRALTYTWQQKLLALDEKTKKDTKVAIQPLTPAEAALAKAKRKGVKFLNKAKKQRKEAELRRAFR